MLSHADHAHSANHGGNVLVLRTVLDVNILNIMSADDVVSKYVVAIILISKAQMGVIQYHIIAKHVCMNY